MTLITTLNRKNIIEGSSLITNIEWREMLFARWPETTGITNKTTWKKFNNFLHFDFTLTQSYIKFRELTGMLQALLCKSAWISEISSAGARFRHLNFNWHHWDMLTPQSSHVFDIVSGKQNERNGRMKLLLTCLIGHQDVFYMLSSRYGSCQ